MNTAFGLDPILTGVLFTPLFYGLGVVVYRIYYGSFERRGEESLRGLVFFFGLLFIIEVSLSLKYGVDYRLVEAAYIGKSIDFGGVGIAFRLLVPFLVGVGMTLALSLFLSRTFYGRAIMGVSQDRLALRLMGANPVRIKTIAFGIGIAAASLSGALLITIAPVVPSTDRDYIGRVFAITVLGGLGSIGGTLVAAIILGVAEGLTPAFFALGAYTSIFLIEAFTAPLPVLILAGGLVSALLGLGIGYLTLRLRGVFFSIATFALAVVLQTLIINWEYVGGAKGFTLIRPSAPYFGSWGVLLFTVMVGLAVVAVLAARMIERSWIGRGLSALRDNEEAAECMGVPTLRLKLFATTVSGFFLGVAGAPFPYYVTYVEPSSAFNLDYAVNALAMPMIGGTTTWIGPVIGAVLLGTAQQVATVTISSELNLLIVGVVLVLFVVLAPEGITGLARRLMGR